MNDFNNKIKTSYKINVAVSLFLKVNTAHSEVDNSIDEDEERQVRFFIHRIIQVFLIPQDENLLKQWETALPLKEHFERKYICENHFLKFQIKGGKKRKRLGPFAVPNENITKEDYDKKVHE